MTRFTLENEEQYIKAKETMKELRNLAKRHGLTMQKYISYYGFIPKMCKNESGCDMCKSVFPRTRKTEDLCPCNQYYPVTIVDYINKAMAKYRKEHKNKEA